MQVKPHRRPTRIGVIATLQVHQELTAPSVHECCDLEASKVSTAREAKRRNSGFGYVRERLGTFRGRAFAVPDEKVTMRRLVEASRLETCWSHKKQAKAKPQRRRASDETADLPGPESPPARS